METGNAANDGRQVVRPIEHLIAVYSESHRNPVNEIIHCVCVPAIVFSIVALLWAVSPLLAAGASVAALAWYAWLSMPFAVGMLAMLGLMLAALSQIPDAMQVPLALTIFVLAWIGQFIGHGIEGKKPSFFDDLRYLLVGPLFVLGVLYRHLGLSW